MISNFCEFASLRLFPTCVACLVAKCLALQQSLQPRGGCLKKAACELLLGHDANCCYKCCYNRYNGMSCHLGRERAIGARRLDMFCFTLFFLRIYLLGGLWSFAFDVVELVSRFNFHVVCNTIATHPGQRLGRPMPSRLSRPSLGRVALRALWLSQMSTV